MMCHFEALLFGDLLKMFHSKKYSNRISLTFERKKQNAIAEANIFASLVLVFLL